MTVIATHIKLGVQFGGVCPLCKRQTGDRPHEKAGTSLYGYTVRVDDKEVKKYLPVHPSCAHGQTKNSTGGLKYRTEPKAQIEVNL